MSSTTAYLSRVLQMLCQPLQGSYSTGAALVMPTGSATLLQPGEVLVPIVNGCEYEEAAVKVERNLARQDRAWEVGSTGTVVAVTSLQGGEHVNLPAGTELRFDEAPTGIAELSSLAVGMTGGARLETFGALRQVRAYKDLGSQIDAQSFFAAQLGEYPAAVLSWAATTPGDGSASPSMGVDQTRMGRGKRFYCHEWNLFVVSTRLESTDRRKREGEIIRDRLLQIFSDRVSWRGVQFSSESHPIKITDARIAKASREAYVDVIRFSNWFILERTEERVFNDWLTTHLVESRSSSAGALETVNIDIPMRPAPEE